MNGEYDDAEKGNRGKFPGGGGSQEFESMIQAGDVTWLE